MLTIRQAKADDVEEIDREMAVDLLRWGDSNLWFHVDAPNEDELQFLRDNLKIHDLTMEDVLIKISGQDWIRLMTTFIPRSIHSNERKIVRSIALN